MHLYSQALTSSEFFYSIRSPAWSAVCFWHENNSQIKVSAEKEVGQNVGILNKSPQLLTVDHTQFTQILARQLLQPT